MSQNNFLQGYNWDPQQCQDVQNVRPFQDEVISVYEVYVKEEETSSLTERGHDPAVPPTSGSTGTMNGTISLSTDDENQLIQRAIFKGECMDLGVAVDSETQNDDDDNNQDSAAVMKLLGKESLKYQIVEQRTINGDENNPVHPNQTVSEQESGNASTGPRLIDKDDPRSRLHFVKYLKRDGKTLKIWECGICTKEFRHQYTLMRHLPTHTDERNFKCDACGKAFRQLSTLSQHKAIHSDARPYVCEFCKKTFNRVSTLISHRKTHSELKPHKCHVCGKGFHQKGNLRNHVFTHTNERPYKCELCGKGFNQMSNLVCHKIKAHAHSEKMQYSCGLCGKEFPRRFALRSHEEYKHGIKYRNPGGIPRDRKPSVGQKPPTSTSTCTSATVTSTTSNETPPTTTTIVGSNVMQNKNVRIVELPSHELNEDPEVGEDSQTEYMNSIVIDRIETKALQNAVDQGQTPFALLKPASGIPVLVKVSTAGAHKHLLTPATADDLQTLGNVTLSPVLHTDPGLKSLQIKVPVVATITQNLEENGEQSFLVEAPSLDQNEESFVAPLDSHFPFQDPESSLRLHSASAGSVYNRQNDDILIDANTTISTKTTTVTKSQSDDSNELLDLAAQGGIQFVRATEDGRYEVMTNNEARELMAQNSHDVTILDGEDADALNIVNARAATITNGCGQEDFMIDHPDSQIMVLDSITNSQKSIGIEAIDIFEDKDIRILDPKNLDDRMIDGMTFLSQMKMDDLILVPGKSSDNISGCAISIASPGSNEFPGIAALLSNTHNNDNNNHPIDMTSVLNKSQHSSNLPIIGDPLNYLKHYPARSLSEELNILNVEEEVAAAVHESENLHHQQQQEHYSGKVKFNNSEGTDDSEFTNSLSIIHERNEQNCSRITDYYRGNEARNYWDNKRNMPSFGEVKILGAKNYNNRATNDSLENSSIQFQDVRILGSYEQYLNSSGFGQKQESSKSNHCETEENMQSRRKEVKILGKKLECGFFENSEDGKLIKIGEDTEKCRRIVNDFWEGWIETNRCSNSAIRYDDDDDEDVDDDEDNEKENDITYVDIINSQVL